MRPGANPNAGPGVLGLAVASFDGTMLDLSKGQLQLDLGEGKALTVAVNKKTQFLDGDKTLKATDLAPGTRVSVEAHKDLGQLIAIRVKLHGRDPHAAPEPELKHRN